MPLGTRVCLLTLPVLGNLKAGTGSDSASDRQYLWVGEHGELYSLAEHSQPGQGAEGKALGQFLQASPKILLCPPISDLAFTPVLGHISNLMIQKEEKIPNLQPAEAAPPDYPLISED